MTRWRSSWRSSRLEASKDPQDGSSQGTSLLSVVLLVPGGGRARRPDTVSTALANRPLIRIDDPYLRFHHAVIRPHLARFEARETANAWEARRGGGRPAAPGSGCSRRDSG